MQTIGILTVNTVNELYNNALTQFMNIQIAVNESKLTKQQAVTMLRNIVNITNVGFKSARRMAFGDMKWNEKVDQDYETEFKKLYQQMQEYMQTELNPTMSL